MRSVLGVEPRRLALIAAHVRDCYGASRAGPVTGWVSRVEREYSPIFARPTSQAPTSPRWHNAYWTCLLTEAATQEQASELKL